MYIFSYLRRYKLTRQLIQQISLPQLDRKIQNKCILICSYVYYKNDTFLLVLKYRQYIPNSKTGTYNTYTAVCSVLALLPPLSLKPSTFNVVYTSYYTNNAMKASITHGELTRVHSQKESLSIRPLVLRNKVKCREAELNTNKSILLIFSFRFFLQYTFSEVKVPLYFALDRINIHRTL